MHPTTYPTEYKGWEMKMGTQTELIGRHWRQVFWCYAASPTGQTTQLAVAAEMDAAYKATCERVDRIEEARK